MIFRELKTIISSGEGERLEVKETTGQGVDACETLCAFLNKDGGTGVWGIGIYKKGIVKSWDYAEYLREFWREN